jgi:hypothetical protein
MELLAFVHSSVNYEDPTPDPELTLDIKVPSSAGVALAGVALAVAAVSASPDKASAATAAIAQGSSGDAVTNVQKALGIQADGQFGPATQTAVMDFQIRQGLKQIDGVVGKETAVALGLDEKYTPTCFGGGSSCGGWGGSGIGFRGIGAGPSTVVTIAFSPASERYYGGWDYQPTGWGGGWDPCYDPCEDYYEPRGYDPCYDPCEDYYEPYSYGCDCYEPVSYDPCYDPCYEPVSYRVRYVPVAWRPCYEPVYYDPCSYEPPCYEPYGYGGYDNGGCGGYEPYYEGHGYDNGYGCNGGYY